MTLDASTPSGPDCGICLDVYAVPGPGNLLGNLLCNVVDLLNGTGNNTGAEPPKNGSGADGTVCMYAAGDITWMP